MNEAGEMLSGIESVACVSSRRPQAILQLRARTDFREKVQRVTRFYADSNFAS